MQRKIEILIIAILIINMLLIIKKKQKESQEKELMKEKSIKEALFQLTHEIKNPLAVINGYLELYESTKSPKKKDKYFKIIKKEVGRSLTIINDFSELGKMQKLEKEILDISLLFEEIIEVLQPLFKENNAIIYFKNNEEIYINGYFERLKQVFINILKNSLESKDKDFLIVEIKIKKNLKDIQVFIIDNGKGMNEAEMKNIKKAFYSTKEKGSGIGLAYVKQILELHDGKIDFKSKEKKGTTVIVTFPINNNSY